VPLKEENFASEPCEPTKGCEGTLLVILKGGKFEMNRSQCPVAKILMYIEVHGFSFLVPLKEENLR
jgi:hypothetical protein